MPQLGERAGLLGLAAFLVVDVVLVGLAVNSTRQPVAAGGTQVGATSSPATPSSSSTSGSSGTATSTPAGARLEVAPLTVGLTAVTSTTALRFTTGRCDKGGSSLELTEDGGRTWDTRPAPFDTITRIRVRPDRSAFAVGAASGGACDLSIAQAPSFDADFGGAQPTADAWFRDPRRADTVGLPSGTAAKPCGTEAVVDLAVADSGAAVLCDDGRVLTSASGDRWKRTATVADGLALAQTSKGRVLVAAAGVGDCDGIALVDTAEPGDALGCAGVGLDDVTPGSVAVAVTSESGWIAVGKDTYRSDRTFSTWKKS